MIGIQLIFVTVLLTLLSGSVGETGVTASMLFGVTSVVTFLCFNLRLRLDFEGVFKFFESVGIGAPTHIDGELEEAVFHSPRKVPSRGLKDLPRPLARQTSRFIESVIRDFIKSWYSDLGQNEEQFVQETRVALEYIAGVMYNRMLEVDSHIIIANLINMYRKHLKVFDECRAAVNQKYPGIPPKDFEKCITELYEARVPGHIATKSQGAEMDYLRVLTDVLVFTLLPPNMFSCEGGRFMLREVLAIQGLRELVDLLTEPEFVNQAVIDILDEPLPVEIIRQRWKEAEEMEEQIDLIENGQHTKHDREDTVFLEKSQFDSDNTEEAVDEFNEASDTNDSKFATPKHSSSELSSEESYDAFHRVLHQNQLEAKSSAPVYGSTTVKLHDNTNQLPLKYILPYNQRVNEGKTGVKSDAVSEAADSGILSITQKPNTGMAFIQPVINNELLNSEEGEAVTPIVGSPKTIIEEAGHFESSHPPTDTEDRKLDSDMLESWAQCPAPSAEVFNRQSFYNMYSKQDKLGEQLKARLTAARLTCIQGSTCFRPHESAMEAFNKEQPNVAQSMEGSATMEFPHSNVDETASGKNINDSRSEGSNIKVHSVEGRNAFYEISPSCPTCVEMTLLASPKENGKLVPVMNKKEEKPKPKYIMTVHDCGLAEAHYCNPETDEEIIENEINDDSSFISCDENTVTDLELSINSIASSDTLLASAESTDSSLSSVYQSKEDFVEKKLDSSPTSSVEVLSLNELDSEQSTLVGTDVASVSSDLPDDVMVIQSPKKHRTPSVNTFKSAVDSLSYNQVESVPFQTPCAPVKAKKSSLLQKEKKSKAVPISKSNRQSSPKIFKFLKERFGAVRRKRSSSARRLTESVHHRTSESDFGSVKDWDVQSSPARVTFPADISDSESCISNSEILDNDSFGDPISSLKDRSFKTPHLDPILRVRPDLDDLSAELYLDNICDNTGDYRQLGMIENPNNDIWSSQNTFGLVEEVGSEAEEEIDVYEDAQSNFGEPFLSLKLKAGLSESKDSLTSSGSDIIPSLSPRIEHPDEDSLSMENRKDSVLIPVYKGEIIMPNPSKIPATAWLYPIQMVSIPNTEVAFEKRWEPGGNKYTLYSIHYDIRIWPDIYQGQILEASLSQSQDVNSKQGSSGGAADPVPLIREIKRRYREFIYLHNRLTHGPMAAKMKGILRPNRRYAMPFGRMDPDVIEGRRKILEYYLVSLVSRPDLCNSREFKEFLGAEGYGNVSFIKPRAVQPKLIFNKQMNRIISGIKTAFPTGSRESGEKTESSQYFIHGYDTPRMFGYGDPDVLERHCMVWLTKFVESQADEGERREIYDSDSVGPVEVFIPRQNVFQRSKSTERDESNSMGSEGHQMVEETSIAASDESTEIESRASYNEQRENMEYSDRRVSGGIAALFATQIAAYHVPEKISELDAEMSTKSGESPWPLSDSVLSLGCQALKGYGSWITYEKVQQAVLFGLGGIIEWLICRGIDDVLIEERWLKYLQDLYGAIWDIETGRLKERKPPLSEQEQKALKEEALTMLLDMIPGIVRVSIGPTAYRQFGEGLLQSLQYKRINRHLLFAALEIILSELIPEFQSGFEKYVTSSSSTGLRKNLK